MTLPRVIRDLQRRKARERRGLALAEGVRLVEELLAAGLDCKGAVVAPGLLATPRGVALRETLAARRVAVEEVTDEALADLAATDQPQGVLAVYTPRAWTLDEIVPGHGRPVVLLDGVQDPGNVGTIARTMLAFGGAGLVALPGTADLTSPKTLRSAMGALFRLPSLHAPLDAVLPWLERHGTSLWVATMHGEVIEGTRLPVPVALVLGNEGAGAGAPLVARADRQVTIPIHPEAESLNVAVAAGILLYQVTR